ncbi:hypothetical protein TOPH_08333 [Tolypocladium ophioglossoides CBS 100239]|uniref:Uncharacterized protein n=1 Tax=Tolypocladium ophioglossoides (strain CBS 100239) TaxID=1163406 RepID=A0A0L0MZX7_TOLOC|nr:hypothetical protein TOPH_08333 [Tolypocladium ophioglossoides CBS 100239]
MADQYPSMAAEWLNMFDNASAELAGGPLGLAQSTNTAQPTNPTQTTNPAQLPQFSYPALSAHSLQTVDPAQLTQSTKNGLGQGGTQALINNELEGVGDRMIVIEAQLRWIYDNQQEIIKTLSALEKTVNAIAEDVRADSWTTDDRTSQSSSEYSEPMSDTSDDDDLHVFNLEELDGVDDLDRYL